MKNAYLAKKELERQVWTEVATRLAEQYMTDTLQITLHQQFGWGYDRLMRLSEKWRETIIEYRPAMDARDNECSLMREHLDRVMVEIIKDKGELIPFNERYPELRKVIF